MIFYIASDLHLEFKFDIILNIPDDNLEKYLLLAGDTCNYNNIDKFEEWLKCISNKFNKIFFISGNHEYYSNGETMDNIDIKLKLLESKFDNVIYLNCDTFILNNVLIVGCTLWSNNKYKYINDYKNIYIENDKLLTLKDSNNLHLKHLDWLIQTLNENKNKDTIVLTHHLPTIKLIDNKYLFYKDLNTAFYTPLDKLIVDNQQIKYWICGHSHSTKECQINNTKLILNAYGYNGENKRFINNKLIKLI